MSAELWGVPLPDIRESAPPSVSHPGTLGAYRDIAYSAYDETDLGISERTRYLEDPVAWARDRIEVTLWSKQRDILQAVCDERRVAVHSCHSAGKTFAAALATAWWIDSHPPGTAFVVSTAPSGPQVKALLWREINRLHAGANLPGRVNLTEWYLNNELVAYGRKPSEYNVSGFQGIHSKYVLVIIDEACHDDQTDVMTDSGWKRFAELGGSERLMSMDPDTGVAKFHRPVRLVARPYSGEMLKYERTGTNFCVTPGHRMWMHYQRPHRPRRWVSETASEAWARGATFGKMSLKKHIDWQVQSIEHCEIPGIGQVDAGAWFRFLGWYLSDGCTGGKGGSANYVCVSQTKPDKRILVQDALNELGVSYSKYPAGFRIYNTKLATYLRGSCGRYKNERRIPHELRLASSAQIRGFLDSYVGGDGYRRLNSEVVYTYSKQMADDLQELALKTGAASVVRKREAFDRQLSDGRMIHGQLSGWVATISGGQSMSRLRPEHRETIWYEGMVYCATLPADHLLLTRRGGYTMWSGNCGVPDILWVAAETIASNEHSKILAVGNPDSVEGQFARKCGPASGWKVVHVGYRDTPNFTGEEVPRILRDVLISKVWVEERRIDWGESSALFQSKVEGVFPSPDADPWTVIPFRLAGPCRYLELEDGEPLEGGIDVAAGGDRTVLVERRGQKVGRIEVFRSSDPIETVGVLAHRVAEWGLKRVKVDVIGVGWGVYGRLRELSSRYYPNGDCMYDAEVIPINFSEKPLHPKRFANKRAEVWWMGRELSRQQGWDLGALDDIELGELTAPKYKIIDSRGAIAIEPKEDIISRLGRSPDVAEALLLAFYSGATPVVSTAPDAVETFKQSGSLRTKSASPFSGRAGHSGVFPARR